MLKQNKVTSFALFRHFAIFLKCWRILLKCEAVGRSLAWDAELRDRSARIEAHQSTRTGDACRSHLIQERAAKSSRRKLSCRERIRLDRASADHDEQRDSKLGDRNNASRRHRRCGSIAPRLKKSSAGCATAMCVTGHDSEKSAKLQLLPFFAVRASRD